MEIRKSDRGLLAEIEAWLSLNRTPEAKDLADLKASILHHLQSTEGEASSWATQSRQLTTEAVNLSTRLIATKFVADEAVGLVWELVAALMQLHTVSSTIFPPENEKVPLLWRMAIQQAAAALSKAAAFTAAIAPAAPTVGGATEPQILPPVDAVPEYVPDWPGVPEPFDHVAVDEDGRVFCFVGYPERRPANGVWYPMSGQYKDVSYITEIPEPPGDTWKQMIYQRPK